MNTLIGLWFAFSAIIIGAVFLFGVDIELKEKISIIAALEVFVSLLTIGSYFLSR